MAKSTPTAAGAAREETAASAHGDRFDRLRQVVQDCLHKFCQDGVTPLALFDLEKALKTATDNLCRETLEELLDGLEPADKKEADPKVRHQKADYRINKRTKATVATTFGNITLWSFLYLHPDDGEPGLHPLHVRLGIVTGTTPALAERVGRWAVDHSQRAVRELLLREHGLKWSNKRLRRVVFAFARQVAPYRQEAQVELLLKWLGEAERSRGRQRPVLSVGRDGVMMPIRGHGFQEASAATVSVHDRRGKRLGTVYLGRVPEAHQKTMSQQLTDLWQAVLKQWTGVMPRLTYVTDKGKAQDEYWQFLRKTPDLRRPGQRLAWEWVLDFFHVCSYIGKLKDALFGSCAKKGLGWFSQMRRWLRDRVYGVANILRSALQHCHRRKLTKAAQAEFDKAYRYLWKHRRHMDYADYRRRGLPIGSGVTEAACKTVFTERLKRSGMRWHKESAQVIVDLRVLHLSGIWATVVRKDLQARPPMECIQKTSQRSRRRGLAKKAG
jgi:hypothetical protein